MIRMDVTPRELRDTDIKSAFRGYDPDDVNDLLERAAATIEAMSDKVRLMSERVNSIQADTGRTRETEDMLHRTLLLAQRAADEAITEAQDRAKSLQIEAESKARSMIAEAEAEVRRIGETERRRVEEEIVDLAARRDALLSDVAALEQWESEYRARVIRQVEADLTMVKGRLPMMPGTRPALTNIDIPEIAPRRVEAPTAAIDRTAELEPPIAVPVAAVTEIAESPTPSMPEAIVAATAQSATAPIAPPVSVSPLGAQQEIDLPAAEATTRELDDDQFFATLRDAVRDDAPLGPPRDEELFDEGREPTFREIFKRRR
jgi:cell division initiation protein